MRVALVVFAVLSWSAPAHADGLTGVWMGAVDINGQPLKFTATFGADGKATVDIPDQGTSGLALDNVKIDGKDVSFAIAKVGAVFKGVIDGDSIKGTLNQRGGVFPFTLQRGKPAVDGYTPPAPARKPLSSSVGAGMIGTWVGTVGEGATMSPLVVEFHDDHGVIAGTSRALHACEYIPLDNITLTFKRVHAEQAGKVFHDGVISGETITGVTHHDGVKQPWSLTREPAVDKPYTETEVSIRSTNGTTLAGTLTTPKGGPAPVVVTITGSGPQDRDECVFGVRPFRQLADHLARHGIATLRYDDRGIARSTGDFKAATAADFADDAQAAVTFLKSRSEIDPKRIGLLGHSEGGIIAPMVGARDSDVSFVVMWAGTGLPLDQVIIRQTGEGGRAEGAPPEDVARQVAMLETALKLVRTSKDRDAYKAALVAAIKARFTKKMLEETGNVDELATSLSNQFYSPWMRWYMGYDPKVTLRKLTVPVLALNGTLDKQVDPTLNLPAIKSALARNKDVSIVELPGLNHMFQQTKTGAGSEYTKNPPVMDPSVLDVTTTWIRKHTGLE